MKAYDPLEHAFQIQQSAPSFFRRTFAFILDISILSLTILAPLSSFLTQVFPENITPAQATSAFSYLSFSISTNETLSSLLTILMLYVCALIVLYFAILEYLIGQTAGKRLLGLQVEDSTGSQPTFWQCIVRNIVFLPVFPFIVFWILDPIYILFTKQRLSEQLSRTKTVTVINQQRTRI